MWTFCKFCCLLVISTVVLTQTAADAYTLVQSNVVPLDDRFRVQPPGRRPASLKIPADSNQGVQSIFSWLSAFYLDPKDNATVLATTASSDVSEDETSTTVTTEAPVEAVVVSGVVSGNKKLSTSNNNITMVDSSNRLLFGASQSSSASANVRNYAFNSFLNFEALIDWYDLRMADNNANPNAAVRIERQILATTEEGRPVLVYKISSADSRRRSTGSRPVLWWDCLIHAREWISGSTCSYMFDRILKDSRTDSSLLAQLQKVDIWIAPVLNPDGYAYTHSTNRFWRKNRQSNPERKQCPGIDLNRNWPAFYTQSNLVAPLSSSESCDDLYAGPTYLTSREAKGVFNFLISNRNVIKVALTFHSFGQLWLIPYGYSDTPGNLGPKFPRYDSTFKLFKPAVDALHRERRLNHMNKCQTLSSNGRNPCEYEFGGTVDVIQYAGGGGSDDAMAAMGICHVATVELPPTGGEPGRSGGNSGFVISPQEIVAVGDEMWKAQRVILKTMADTMTTSYCLNNSNNFKRQYLQSQQQPENALFDTALPVDGESGAGSAAALFVELESKQEKQTVRKPLEPNVLQAARS